MRAFLILLFFVPSVFGAFTELYVQPNGSNLNAGSSAEDTSRFAFPSGDWDASTGIFSVRSGNPVAEGVAVGEWASIFPDDATVTPFVARITAVSTTSIAVSLAVKSGTPPITGVGNRTLRVGGAWKGPNGQDGFPFGFVQQTQVESALHPIRVNIRGGLDYEVARPLTHPNNGSIRFEGYSKTPGDGGFAKLRGQSVFTLMTVSGVGSSWRNIWFDSGAVATPATPTNQLVHVTGLSTYMYRCKFSNGWRSGLRGDGGGSVFEECEAFGNNMDDASAFGQFQVREESTFIRCRAYDSTYGKDCIGFSLQSGSGEPVTLIECVAENNGGEGFKTSGGGPYSLTLIRCIARGNGADGFELSGDAAGSSVILIQETSFINNGGWGISGANFRSGPLVVNSTFINNQLGEITAVNPSFLVGTISKVAHPPTVTPQSLEVMEDSILPVVLAGTDIDADPLNFTVVNGPVHGNLAGTPPFLNYTPALNYFGTDSFQVIANDGIFNSEPATISIQVRPANDNPQVLSQTLTLLEDSSIEVYPVGTDIDGDALTFAVASPPAHGVISGTVPMIYTPNANFAGVDSFTVVASDGSAQSEPATFTMQVTEVEDLIILGDADLSVTLSNARESLSVRQPVEYTVVIQNGGPIDVPNARIILSIPAALKNRIWACVSSEGSECISEEPVAIEDSTDELDEEFSISAGSILTFKLTVTIDPSVGPGNIGIEAQVIVPSTINDPNMSNNTAVDVDPVVLNNAPVAQAANVTVEEDGTFELVLTATDADGDSLSFSISAAPGHGTLSGVPPNITYAPSPDFYGIDSFSFAASDGLSASSATITITVTPVSEPPTATPAELETSEDLPLAIALAGTDPDGDALTFEVVANPIAGVLSGVPPELSYTPSAGVSGVDSFSFRVSDGVSYSAAATVSINVKFVNDTPVVISQVLDLAEDSMATVTLGGTDEEGEPIIFAVSESPTHGTLAGTSPNLTYTPNPNYFGSDSFKFTGSDGNSSGNGTITFNVAAVLDEPIAVAQELQANEDTDLSIKLSGIDPDNEALTFTIVTSPVLGSLSGDAPTVTYRPNANATGLDSFTFTVSDGVTVSEPNTVAIQIVPVNDAPLAQNQSVLVAEDGELPITLAAIDEEGDAITYTVQDLPANGSISGVPPNIAYSPAPNFFGIDSFTFAASDGSSSSIGTVNIHVTPAPDAPSGVAQTVVTDEDQAVQILLVAIDADGDLLEFEITSEPNGGALSGTPPAITYTPSPNVNGTDLFRFTVSDGVSVSEQVAVTIQINPVNDAPVAQSQAVEVTEDTEVDIVLNATDEESDEIAFSIESGPTHGTVTGLAPNVRYIPAANYTGPDAFTFTASDGTKTLIGTVTINVTPMPDAPLATPQAVVTQEDAAISIELAGIDVDGDALTFSVSNPPTLGTLSGVAPAITYTPNANAFGTDSFTFVTSDGTLQSQAATISITIHPVNDAPFVTGAIADRLVDGTDTSFAIDLSAVFADLESSSAELSYTATSSDTLLASPLIVGGNLVVQMPVERAGNALLTVRATDAGGLFVEDAFTLTVIRPGTRVSVSDATGTEGASAGVVFTVTLSAPQSTPVTVPYSAVAVTAIPGVDIPIVSGTLTFAAGIVSQTVKVTTINDTIDELDETFELRLGTPTGGAVIGDGTGVGTIVDNDTSSLTVANISKIEGTGGNTPAILTIAISNASDRDVSVSYNTVQISAGAVAGSDFIAVSGTVTFPAGTTAAKTIPIQIIGDRMDENTEGFNFVLSDVVNGVIGRASARVELVDDDEGPTVTISDVTISEGNSGDRDVIFTLTLSEVSGVRVRVQYATADGTAQAGLDYVARTGEVSFDSGVTSRTVVIDTLPDTLFEVDETFFLNLHTPTRAIIGDAQATATIVNDD